VPSEDRPAGGVDQVVEARPPTTDRPSTQATQRSPGRAQERRRTAPRAAGPAARDPRSGTANRYERMHLYVTQEMKDQVHSLQGQALTAGVPLGARGPSVVMAAALDVLLELSPSKRLDVIRRRLQRALTTRA
jgi:hypothetical protein